MHTTSTTEYTEVSSRRLLDNNVDPALNDDLLSLSSAAAFNNIMFDHAQVRPRVLRKNGTNKEKQVEATSEDGYKKLDSFSDSSQENSCSLFASTVFGPTCDSIDVIARSVLLPKLSVGDWMYFQNMGAYTMAASSSFNGFTPSEKFYVCSVQPDYFERIIRGPNNPSDEAEEKKAEE